MPRPKRKFKVGHMYAIDYDDHYSTEKAYREEEDGGPMKLRARGVVLLETAKTVVIEYKRSRVRPACQQQAIRPTRHREVVHREGAILWPGEDG